MHARRFGIVMAKLPFDETWPPVKAVVPKVALMDTGIVWLVDRIVGAS
jgi:hypothetical protein